MARGTVTKGVVCHGVVVVVAVVAVVTVAVVLVVVVVVQEEEGQQQQWQEEGVVGLHGVGVGYVLSPSTPLPYTPPATPPSSRPKSASSCATRGPVTEPPGTTPLPPKPPSTPPSGSYSGGTPSYGHQPTAPNQT